jgi:alkanesulfonate monooxygenase SsuD/methylene tetrahydromethanopterin reductase-like flavin-dependent oxidoreductase (luciferase family)
LLKFGVITPNLNSPRKLVEFAKTAEEAGFDHLLLSDHYFIEEYHDMFDSWATIGYLAGQTSTLKFGTCVTPITFRPPLHLAKIVTTLDHLTNGRIIVGVGAGWDKAEYDMFSHYYPNKERFAQFKEALQILVEAWTNGKVNFSGKFYSAKDVVALPLYLQRPTPPLLFGGWGSRMVRLAGNRGNGWTPTGPRSGETVKTPEDYSRFVQVLDVGLQKRGMKHDEFLFGCRFGPMTNLADYQKEIESFSSAGLNCYQLGVNAYKHSKDIIEKFGDTVIAGR